jgi:hypothetical protein
MVTAVMFSACPASLIPGTELDRTLARTFRMVGQGGLNSWPKGQSRAQLGRQSALAETYGLYRMIQAECRVGGGAHRRLAECFQLDGVQEYTQLFDSIGLRCTDSISELHASLT